ncbi:MAG: SUMF1/EgtB/PvdO family nonheme iron enzyme [Treponema sp.]|nr:SUMF1/EgtB/PvdO family nonheme iron enzyme [Candidatus Treponema equifaecale]
MKSCIKFLAGSALIALLAFTGCSADTEIEKLSQEQMVSKLDENSKSDVFDEVLKSKNADELLEKLSDEQKSKIFDKMLTDEKKTAIFDELLTDEKKDEIYNEKLTETEKASIFDELLKTKTSKDFIVEIITKEGNETLYNEVKSYIKEKLTQTELVALLNEDSKTAIFEAVLAGKNAEALLAKLSDEQKEGLLDKLLTDDKKNEVYKEKLTSDEKLRIFNEILADKRSKETFLSLLTPKETLAIKGGDITDAEKVTIFNDILADKRSKGKVTELLTTTEKTAVFDAMLATKTSKDFIVGILTKEGNEALYDEVKDYITGKLTQAELVALLDDDSKTSVFESQLAEKDADSIFAKLSDEQKSALVGKMLTDEKKNEIYAEKLTDEEKSKIFDKILTDKRTSDTFLELLEPEEKEAVYTEFLTDDKKAEIFGELLNKIRTEKELVEYFTDEEKAAIFDAVLNTKTGAGFVVEIIGKLEEEGNGELYSEIRQFFLDLEATDKTAPGEVTNLKATEAPYAVKLTWTDGRNDANDLYGYLVSWTGVSNSRAVVMLEKNSMMVPQSLKGDKSNGITITDLIGGTKYRFTVQAVDLIGNKSTGVTVEATPKASSVVAQEALAAGTYTIYHLQQKPTGEKNVGDYDLFEKIETPVEANSSLNDLKKDYPGFTAMTVTQNGNAIYVFYDRNLITYIFNTGDEGAFKDGSKSRTVSGLYGAKYRIERPKHNNPTEKELKEWKSGEYSAEKTFDSVDHTFEPVWAEYGTVAPDGFVVVDGVSIEGTEIWRPSSNVFVSGRALEIPLLFVCDHEVTRGEFKAVMGTDPSTAKAYDKDGNELTGDDVLTNPVNYVNWYAAIAYCNKLSIKENLTPCYSVEGVTDWTNLAYSSIPTSSSTSSLRDKWDAATCDFEANGYRLPTNAEFEWLARGGENYTYAGSNNIKDVAWYEDNIDDKKGTREVKQKAPNGYGLYDMSGNVWEWCWDRYTHNSTITRETPATGDDSGKGRLYRGGHFYTSAIWCSVNYRSTYSSNPRPTDSETYLGFRVVRNGTILK